MDAWGQERDDCRKVMDGGHSQIRSVDVDLVETRYNQYLDIRHIHRMPEDWDV